LGITGNILMATTSKIQFHDTGLYVNASGDGALVISSDGTIAVGATTSYTLTSPAVKFIATTSVVHQYDAASYVTQTVTNAGLVTVTVTGDSAGSYEIVTDDTTIVLDAATSISLEAGAGTYGFSATTLDMNTLTITDAGTITTTNIIVGTAATGIDFTGTYSSHALDFSNATQVAGDISLIRAGTYTTGMDAAGEAQYGMVRLYLDTDDDGASYNRGVFVCLKTSGTKGIFPISGLAEVLTDAVGPTKAQAAQFIVGLHEAGSNLATAGGDSTAGMYGAWLKVYSIVGSVAASGSKVAPVWVDNQMSGTVSGEEYGMFATTGGTRPDGFIGFETSSSGYDQFIYADSTFNAGAGTCITTDAVPGGNQTARIKVWYDSTQYYIPLYR